MPRLFTTLAILAVGAASHIFAANPLAGWWKGQLMMMPIVIHIEDSAGVVSARLYSPAQSPKAIPVSGIEISGDTLSFRIDHFAISYRGTVSAVPRKISGTFTQDRNFRLSFYPATENDAILYRPQTPQPPFFYNIEDTVFTNGPLMFGTTITSPLAGPPAGGVVLVSGSGPQNRDEELFGHKPFAVIADHLTRCGWTVLRYDDRGTGRSSKGSKDDTTLDLAGDAMAAVRRLRSTAALKGKPVGILGHSEGGLIAMINAAEHPTEVDFIISLAGPAIKGTDLMVRQNEMIAELSGAKITPARRDSLQKAFGTLAADSDTCRLMTSLRKQLATIMPDSSAREASIRQIMTPWYRAFMAMNPETYLKRIKCPVLALNGLWDVQVEAMPNLRAIEANVAGATIRAYPGLNHMFQKAESKAASLNYGNIPQTISPEVLDDIADFMIEVTRRQ